jgi:hypothetical protein
LTAKNKDMFIQKEISLPAFGRGYHLITDIIKKEIVDFKNDGPFKYFHQAYFRRSEFE